MKYLLFTAFILILFFGCNKSPNYTIKVDMSYERDQLQDPEGDWIFEIELKEIPDTLEFKFAMTSEVNLDLPNAGLEIIPNRRLARTVIENDTPVLTFNKNWSPYTVEEIKFAVSMHNQEVLGFFDPKNDNVVVTGSFTGWDSNGVELDDKDGDGVYEKTIPIEVNPDQPHLFKYKIVKPEGFDGYVPNGGWEISDDRVVSKANSQLHYFNNQQRIARFLVDKDWLNKQSENGIELSDMYQIRFFVGEESYLSDPLELTETGKYETSVSIPLHVDKLVWTIVENQAVELMDAREETVPHTGKKIIIP